MLSYVKFLILNFYKKQNPRGKKKDWKEISRIFPGVACGLGL